jgi:hypothetical protein
MKYIFHFIVIILCPIIILLFFKNIEGLDYYGFVTEYAGPFKGYDYPGNDLEHYTSITADACKEKCNYTHGCVGILIRDNNVDCWLKSKFQNKRPDGGLNTYYSGTKWRILDNYEYRLNDVGSYENKNIDECKKLCIDTENCNGFVINGSNNGSVINGSKCWLKSKFENSRYNSDSITYMIS